MANRIWDLVYKGKSLSSSQKIINTLLDNRGIKATKDKKTFLDPPHPKSLSLKEVGISESQMKKAFLRIKKAIKAKEKIIVYGDYDADGICATAILWEALHSLKANALPYIPERFSEGYGLNLKSIEKLKAEDKNIKLIVTVDNGIVADKAVEGAGKLGIDVIITDHHEEGKVKPKAHALLHTKKIGGAGVSWFLARELTKAHANLELAAIGTIADQLPLIGANRSLVSFGLEELGKTSKPGLKALIESSSIKGPKIGTYEVGFLIAPRLNAAGRLSHAIESLRLICTKSPLKAKGLSDVLGKANLERQKILEEIVIHARSLVKKDARDLIILSHESYHEGVIGLAASRLVEEFYRPAIVLSKKGDVSKASARSIPGFNIIDAIRKVNHLIIEGGGHEMAAGFSIETQKLGLFQEALNRQAKKFLTKEVLSRRLKIDMELGFDQIKWELMEGLKKFDPTGLGNPTPTFLTKEVEVVDAKVVGQEGKHLSLKLQQDGNLFRAIAFGFGELYDSITPETKLNIVYAIEEDTWSGNQKIQLKIKDIRN